MRRVFIFSLIFCAVLILRAGAQTCPTCYVAGNVDIPSQNGAPYPGYLAGWGFECGSGAHVDIVDVYYTRPDDFHRVTDATLYTGLERLDVYNYFVNTGLCPSVQSNTGWAVYPGTPIPSGHWTLSVVMKKGWIYTTQSREVDIP